MGWLSRVWESISITAFVITVFLCAAFFVGAPPLAVLYLIAAIYFSIWQDVTAWLFAIPIIILILWFALGISWAHAEDKAARERYGFPP